MLILIIQNGLLLLMRRIPYNDNMSFINYIEPAAYYVLLTIVFAMFTIEKNKLNNNYLLFILFICLITELSSAVLEYNHYPFDLVYSISIIIHISLWLIIISKQVLNKKVASIFLATFLLFSSINLFFGEGLVECNFNTFIVGALLYIILFIYESFYQLKKENFTFFKSNNYLLLFCPVIFFFGLSFVFGFKSKELAETIVFNKMALYDFIIYFVNIIYYTLINIYIYREKRLKHAG